MGSIQELRRRAPFYFWNRAARGGELFDAPKSGALKHAMLAWGVIETSREVLLQRREAEELTSYEDDGKTGAPAWSASAQTMIEVRPRTVEAISSAMAELTKAAHDPNYMPAMTIKRYRPKG